MQCTKGGKSARDLKESASISLEARKLRGVFDQEPDSLPEELFVKPIHIYTTDISHLSNERTNRHELARMIDSYQIDEVTRQRIKQEAMIEPPRFFDHRCALSLTRPVFVVKFGFKCSL